MQQSLEKKMVSPGASSLWVTATAATAEPCFLSSILHSAAYLPKTPIQSWHCPYSQTSQWPTKQSAQPATSPTAQLHPTPQLWIFLPSAVPIPPSFRDCSDYSILCLPCRSLPQPLPFTKTLPSTLSWPCSSHLHTFPCSPGSSTATCASISPLANPPGLCVTGLFMDNVFMICFKIFPILNKRKVQDK